MKLFKSHLAIILVIAMLIASFGFTAFAQEKVLDASVDYETATVSITYTSPLEYDTYVSFYVVPASDAEKLTDFTKVVCMEQVVCSAKSPVVAKIIYDPTKMDGLYDVFAVPGGVDSAKGYAKLANAFKVFGTTTENTVLADVNGKTKDTIGSAVATSLKDALNLESTDCPQWKSEILYQIKAEDYNGSFSSIAEVTNAWFVADDIYAINTAKDEAALISILENADDDLEFDILNQDYIDNKTAFATAYLANKADVTSETVATKLFNETLVVTTFNNSDVEGKAGVIENYMSVLGLTEYEALIKQVTPAAIARLLSDKNSYTIVTDIKIDVIAKIDELKNAKPVIPSGSGGGSSSGGGFGGGSNITLPAPSAPEATGSKFSDIPYTHWANTAVETLADRNVINGYPDNTFKGDNTVTREEFVKMAVSAFGVVKGDGQVKAFTDVATSFWAKSYIEIAVSAGVINGVSDMTFGVEQPVTRQDAAVIIARILKLANGNGKTFADDSAIAEYAKDAVSAMSGAGIINGYEDGTFKPNGLLSRAEAAQIIYNALTK